MAIFFLLLIAFSALGMYQSYSSNKELKLVMSQYRALTQSMDNFKMDTSFTDPGGNCFIALDLGKREFLFSGKLSPVQLKEAKINSNKNIIWHRVVQFDEIVKSEILVDDELVSTKGVGRAFAGERLFGGVGAIVGASTGRTRYKKIVKSIKLKVIVNDIMHPACEMVFFTKAPLEKLYIKAKPAQENCQVWQDRICVVTAN